MHQQRENLDFLFRRISPERLLDRIRASHFLPKKTGTLKEDFTKLYHHYAPQNMSEYSSDELDLRAEALFQDMDSEKEAGIFAPIVSYAENVLRIRDREPVCKLEETLNWNSITKRLGQDVFTSCWLAWKDCKAAMSGDWSFTWPAVIRTDDKYLDHILKKGLAENHFHLNGSTQVFSLSWVCLMNHPEAISKVVKMFKENLSVSISRETKDNMKDWGTRLWYAVAIREFLYQRCIGNIGSKEVSKGFRHFYDLKVYTDIIDDIEALRESRGAGFLQLSKRKKCLDYANDGKLYRLDPSAPNRLLAGERSFLYHCFCMQFRGELSVLESDLLHLYLIIKHNFAGELIQNNNLYGFHNFAEYQDRKELCYGDRVEYVTEAYRLAVLAQIKDNHLVSLEARIMPSERMKEKFDIIDRKIALSDPSKKEWQHYYVVHFPKRKFTLKDIPKNMLVEVPRNQYTRKNAKKNAKVLKEYIQQNEILKSWEGREQRLYGIDACSKEIGCGPETFATEFRYLRACNLRSEEKCWWKVPREDYTALGFTYHAGEDFLDIMDGLRSIDEAIEFLQMERGDRIGHAVALGIYAADFYALKRYSIYLTKQHYLDNLVWILFRTLEWNIPLDMALRAKFEKKARELLYDVYWDNKAGGDYSEGMLDFYYYSWKLRGDHPDVYALKEKLPSWSFEQNSYENFMERVNDEQLSQYRNFHQVKRLLKLYHFDNNVKRRGLEATQLQIDDWKAYAELVTQFQNRLQRKIADKGIAVESNLTSNVLIGTFRRYDVHPILRFNRHKLEWNQDNPNILASLNTDDLGVFATSLGNEYALLLCAMRKAYQMEGKYDDTTIYDYLDYLRECGIKMAFKNYDPLQKGEKERTKGNVKSWYMGM